MQNQRLSDQVVILESILDLKKELEVAHYTGAPKSVGYEILGRLINLYSVLDIKGLAEAAQLVDAQNSNVHSIFEKKAA